VLPRIGVRVRDLDVVGHRDVGDASPGVRRPYGYVDDRGKLRPVVNHLVSVDAVTWKPENGINAPVG
jgi:hypothetical protein